MYIYLFIMVNQKSGMVAQWIPHWGGSTVLAGYVDEFGSIHGPFVDVQGKRYFPTQDRLKRLEEGGYACLGRADSLVKVGGAYRDLATFEAQVGELRWQSIFFLEMGVMLRQKSLEIWYAEPEFLWIIPVAVCS